VASTVRTANAVGKPVTLCGEMAGDPVCSLVLIGMGLRELSMGMSNDYEVAIEEGATQVRIGTALFE